MIPSIRQLIYSILKTWLILWSYLIGVVVVSGGFPLIIYKVFHLHVGLIVLATLLWLTFLAVTLHYIMLFNDDRREERWRREDEEDKEA